MLRFVRNQSHERGDPLGDHWLNVFAKVEVSLSPVLNRSIKLVVTDTTHAIAYAFITWEECIEIHTPHLLDRKYLYAEAMINDIVPVAWEKLPSDGEDLPQKEARALILKTMKDCGWLCEEYTTGGNAPHLAEAFDEWVRRIQ